MPRHRARRRKVVCVPMRRRRFDTRSATTPAGSEKRSEGSHCSALTMPSRNAECVSCSTSHACPTDCIHVPMSDTDWPAKNS